MASLLAGEAEALAHVDAVVAVAGRAVDLAQAVLLADHRRHEVEHDGAGRLEVHAVHHQPSVQRQPDRAQGAAIRRSSSASIRISVSDTPFISSDVK